MLLCALRNFFDLFHSLLFIFLRNAAAGPHPYPMNVQLGPQGPPKFIDSNPPPYNGYVAPPDSVYYSSANPPEYQVSLAPVSKSQGRAAATFTPKPTNMAPKQPANKPPKQPANMAPKQPANMAPKKTSNMAPKQPSNMAPKQPSNMAPKQPSKMAPKPAAIARSPKEGYAYDNNIYEEIPEPAAMEDGEAYLVPSAQDVNQNKNSREYMEVIS